MTASDHWLQATTELEAWKDESVSEATVPLQNALWDSEDRADALQAEVDHLVALLKQYEPGDDDIPSGYTAINAGTNLQAALDRYGKVAIMSGRVEAPAPVKMDDGYALHTGPQGECLKTFNSSGATTNSMFINKDWNKFHNDIRFTGKGIIQAGQNMGGNIFGLKAHRLMLKDFRTPHWTGGRFYMTAGDDHLYDKFTAVANPASGSGTGGGRFGGGARLRASFSIESGDDALQLVPAGAPTDPLFNAGDIIDALYYDCWAVSYTARQTIAGLQDSENDGDTSLGMRNSILGYRFEKIRGSHGGAGHVVKNVSSMGKISNGVYVDVESIFDPGPNPGQPGHVYLQGDSDCGRVENIDLSGITIPNWQTQKMRNGNLKKLYDVDGPVYNITKPVGA